MRYLQRLMLAALAALYAVAALAGSSLPQLGSPASYSGGGAGLSIGASNSNTDITGDADSISVTLTGTTAGSTILVVVYFQQTNITAISCSDTVNGSYTGTTFVNDGNQGVGEGFYFQNNAGGNLTITASETTPGGPHISIGAVEVKGAVTSGGVTYNSKIFNGSSGGGALPSVSASSGDMVVGGEYGDWNATAAITNNYTGASPSSGWTIASNTNTGGKTGPPPQGAMSYQLMSESGTDNDAYALTGTTYAYGAAFSFLVAP